MSFDREKECPMSPNEMSALQIIGNVWVICLTIGVIGAFVAFTHGSTKALKLCIILMLGGPVGAIFLCVLLMKEVWEGK